MMELICQLHTAGDVSETEKVSGYERLFGRTKYYLVCATQNTDLGMAGITSLHRMGKKESIDSENTTADINNLYIDTKILV